MHFSLRKDIFNHKDISCFSFFNNVSILFMIDVYSDDHQSALKDTETNIWNILVIAGNFNIWNSNWDLSYPFYLIHSDFLFNIIDSFNLMLSSPINHVSTHYSDNMNDTNSVIDLMFLKPNFSEIDNHIICSELHYLLTMLYISITEEFV